VTHKRHIEALHHLATGKPVVYVRCLDCTNWASRCLKGRTVTLPSERIHICGEYQPKEVMNNE
jgi:hypothetical protein